MRVTNLYWETNVKFTFKFVLGVEFKAGKNGWFLTLLQTKFKMQNLGTQWDTLTIHLTTQRTNSPSIIQKLLPEHSQDREFIILPFDLVLDCFSHYKRLTWSWSHPQPAWHCQSAPPAWRSQTCCTESGDRIHCEMSHTKKECLVPSSEKLFLSATILPNNFVSSYIFSLRI
jgi:hypothetical protein